MEAFNDLVELFEDRCQRFAERELFGEKRDGGWEWITYETFGHLVDDFRGGLVSLGIGRGDRVAIVSRNRIAWAVAAYATYGLGAVYVPMYEAQRPDEWKFILEDCDARIVLGSGDRVVRELLDIKASVPRLEHVIAIDDGTPAALSYRSLLERGRERPAAAIHPGPDAIAGFIYTSGTTGRPKGVILNHRNLCTNIIASTSVFPLEPTDRSLSFLPWAHVYGQVVELHILFSVGASTAFNVKQEELIADLAEIKPTLLVAVPRIFNKIHDGVRAQIAGKPAVIRALFRAGLRNSQRRAAGEHLGPIEALELRLADRLIFSKVRAKFGGRLRYAASASAALSHEVAVFIDALGIPVYEGYGLTETSPVISMNRPGARKLGTVGQAIPGVTVTIDESVSPEAGQGEIVVHGPNVMQGYHQRPEENVRTLNPDGSLRTGDLGFLDDDGFLHITGRIKEQYKLENGKYVMPTPLEETLQLSPYIISVMLHGANRRYNVALVVLNVAAVRSWAEQQGVTLGDDLTTDERVRGLITHELEHYSEGFKSFERPRDFVLTTEEFTTENDQLTPTLKLKRRNIVARYGTQLDALYRLATPEAARRAPEARA